MSAALALPARSGISTPGLLQRAMATIAALSLLAAAASLWAAAGISDAARTIGHDAEPSVALGLLMAATLGDLDAASVDDALTDGGTTFGTSRAFQAGLADLSRDLVEAARNITYGEAEAAPLRDLQRLLLLYEEAVAEARYIGAGSPALTAARVEWASRVDRDLAAPQAEALASANADELEHRYAAYRANSGIMGALGVGAFGLLLAALMATQVWLARRTRRLVNPPLALASLLTAASLLWFAYAVIGEREDLRAAKNDAYDSLHVLFQARAAVNTIRADMSLWLLDPGARADRRIRMEAAVKALVGGDINLAKPASTYPILAALQEALTLEENGQPKRALAAAPQLGGLLGAELGNVTYGVAERSAATDSVERLIDAETVARWVQGQEASQDHSGAIRRWLEDGPHGGSVAFAKVQEAIDRTIAVNQTEFDRHVAAALARAALIPFVTVGAMALAALLAVAGLWLRLREYR
jgi:hypothetical protein